MKKYKYKFFMFKKPYQTVIKATSIVEADLEFNMFLRRNLEIISKEETIDEENVLEFFKDIFK